MASLSETTTVGSFGAGLCKRVADAGGLNNSVVWPTMLAVPLVALSTRLLIEIWRCRAATFALVLAASGFLVAATIHFDVIAPISTGTKPLIQRGVWLA